MPQYNLKKWKKVASHWMVRYRIPKTEPDISSKISKLLRIPTCLNQPSQFHPVSSCSIQAIPGLKGEQVGDDQMDAHVKFVAPNPRRANFRLTMSPSESSETQQFEAHKITHH